VSPAVQERPVPIYEYACPDCGHQFELMQKMSEPPATDCPECKAGHVKKLISRTSFVLQGGGWYSDHYGLKSGGGENGGSEKGAGDKGPSGGEKAPGSSESKAAPAASSGGSGGTGSAGAGSGSGGPGGSSGGGAGSASGGSAKAAGA
jgi:putative FmdB family regulatory protein